MTAEFSPSTDESLLDQYVELLATDPSAAEKLAAARPDLADLFTCLRTLDLLSEQLSDDRTIVDDPSISPEMINEGEVTQEYSAERRREAGSSVLPGLGEFGRFQLLEEIGRGGMGVVFRAEQVDLKRTVAVKMILGNHLAHPQQVKRFYREAKAAGKLRHPHIVAVHEVGDVNGQHYFSMDYIGGENLAERLRRGPMSNEEAIKVLLPIVEGVEFLHSQGVLHRDLKPSNILFDERGTPYISDFGLARLLETDDSQTESGCMIGSINYMPPEQARGETGSTTPRSDIFALGAMLYEMVTGRPPFAAPTKLDTLLRLLQGEPPLPRSINPGISPELQAICLRCLSHDQNDRYPSARELAEDLRRLLKGEAIQIPREGFFTRAWKWARREPALSSRLGGITLVFIIIQARWMYDGFDLRHHLQNIAILAGWGAAAFVNQYFARRERYAEWSQSAMSIVDCLLLTAILSVAAGPLGALWSIYSLLIVTSGLFWRTVPVIVTTTTAILCSVVLYWIHPNETTYGHYVLIHIGLLILVGTIVHQQVKRIRVLDRYCEQLRG